jgi:hypothetical protein
VQEASPHEAKEKELQAAHNPATDVEPQGRRVLGKRKLLATAGQDACLLEESAEMGFRACSQSGALVLLRDDIFVGLFSCCSHGMGSTISCITLPVCMYVILWAVGSSWIPKAGLKQHSTLSAGQRAEDNGAAARKREGVNK